MSNLIFDFDGTVADTFPLVVDITYKITKAQRLAPARIEALRQVPLLQAVRQLGGHVWDIPFLVALTRRAMLPRMNEVPSFPGLNKALKELSEAGHELIIISANSQENVRAFLEKHKLSDYFASIHHCNLFRKSAAIRTLKRRRQWPAKHTYYIGNEAADIDEAVSAGVRSVAVTWSGQDPSVLERAQPDFLIDSPGELVALVGKAA